ncbi:MAG: glycosyltransferase family 9 protein [Chloroflexota bacterium]
MPGLSHWPYTLAGRVCPRRSPPANPRRIVLIRPCCIGDVVLATAALRALRRGYPEAHITWAVGRWSRAAVAGHDAVDMLLDTGPAANPAAGLRGVRHFANLLRAGNHDLAVSLVRSPWMSLALLLSGIPHRAGIDSAGRGFGYTVRTAVDPNAVRHEAEIYLDVVQSLGIETGECHASVPVQPEAARSAGERLVAAGVSGDYIMINPAGGSNPGMALHAKRWPPAHFAALADALADETGVRVVLVAGPDDGPIVERVRSYMKTIPVDFVGTLSFSETAAMARGALVYIGNDTGLTHLAAAAGARTVMIFGPSDPARYAPFVPDALVLWKPVRLVAGGVARADTTDWDWSRDGISMAEALEAVRAYLMR